MWDSSAHLHASNPKVIKNERSFGLWEQYFSWHIEVAILSYAGHIDEEWIGT
jgi:hypothetical protein